MTTVLAVQGQDWSYIGCDSAVVDTNSGKSWSASSSKVYSTGKYVFSGAGALSGLTLLWNMEKLPEPPKQYTLKEMDEFVARKLVPYIKKVYKASELELDDRPELLVSIDSVLYEINSDFSWCRDSRGVYGVGTGSSYGLPILLVREATLSKEDAELALKAGLQVASEFDAFTCPPFELILSEKANVV